MLSSGSSGNLMFCGEFYENKLFRKTPEFNVLT